MSKKAPPASIRKGAVSSTYRFHPALFLRKSTTDGPWVRSVITKSSLPSRFTSATAHPVCSGPPLAGGRSPLWLERCTQEGKSAAGAKNPSARTAEMKTRRLYFFMPTLLKTVGVEPLHRARDTEDLR